MSLIGLRLIPAVTHKRITSILDIGFITYLLKNVGCLCIGAYVCYADRLVKYNRGNHQKIAFHSKSLDMSRYYS